MSGSVCVSFLKHQLTSNRHVVLCIRTYTLRLPPASSLIRDLQATEIFQDMSTRFHTASCRFARLFTSDCVSIPFLVVVRNKVHQVPGSSTLSNAGVC